MPAWTRRTRVPTSTWACGLRAAGHCRQAQRALARAHQFDPLNALILSELGVVLALQKKLAPAEKALRQAVRLDPSFGGAWHPAPGTEPATRLLASASMKRPRQTHFEPPTPATSRGSSDGSARCGRPRLSPTSPSP